MKDTKIENIETAGGDFAGRDMIDHSQGKTEINGPVVIYNGITEERARLICKQEYELALQNWSFEAGAIAERRVMALENKVMPKMLEYDKTLSIFGDPAFQILLRKAQITAACTESEKDLDLLSDLILHRAEENENRSHRVGIAKAIEIVDQIETTALTSLSLLYAYKKYYPVTNDIKAGLSVLDNLYGKIIGDINLPETFEWIEQLDILSVVRISGIGEFKKAKEHKCNALDFYLTLGVKKDSEDYNNMLNDFIDVQLPLDIFVSDHPLRNGYVRWSASNDIDNIFLIKTQGTVQQRIELTPKQKEVLTKHHDILNKDGSKNTEIKDAFWKLYTSYSNLKRVSDWWDSFPRYFEITPIGAALANAYLQGVEPTLPRLY